jgi:hypothetical protein
VTDADLIRDQALQVARGWSGPDAAPGWTLTASLFAGLAADDALLDLARAIPEDRLPPLLFVASVQLLATASADDPFAAYFPEPGGPQPALDDGFASRYREFCLARRAELVSLWARHRYQMNEVARTVQVALALADVARVAPGRAVALVDVGTGAGLGLLPDRYAYVLAGGVPFGDPASPVVLRCELRGPARPAVLDLPTVAYRVGIDVDPIDLDDADARAWLLACLPPEAGALGRVVPAMERVRAERPAVVRGDVLDVLPEVLATVPDDVLVCLTDAYTAVFLDDDGRRQLRQVVAGYGRTRDVAWISLDPLVPLGAGARHTVQGVEAPAALVARNRAGGVFALLATVFHGDGVTRHRILAAAHPSGTRMEWLADPRP